MKKSLASLFAATALLSFGLTESAQSAQFPSRTLTIVVPYGPGGPTDTVARVLADGLSRTWGQPSLQAVHVIEKQSGFPVISAATSTAYSMLVRLNLNPAIPDAGFLLSGKFATSATESA